jgi:hypothetical protein
MNKPKITLKSYSNATKLKYHNARVEIFSLPNEDYSLEFKILSSKEEVDTPRALHKTLKGKVTVTGLKLSKIGALAVYLGLQEQLKKDGLI